MTRPTPGSARAAGVDGHQHSTRSATGNATPLNGLSTSSGTPGPWPPATTSATTCTEAPSPSPPSGSGCATRSHTICRTRPNAVAPHLDILHVEGSLDDQAVWHDDHRASHI